VPIDAGLRLKNISADVLLDLLAAADELDPPVHGAGGGAAFDRRAVQLVKKKFMSLS
jgi:hypothetical protein